MQAFSPSRRPRFCSAPLAMFLAALATACGDEPTTSQGPSATPTPGTEPATAAAPAARGRLIMLGFDGVDPRWLEQWAAEGKLPNLSGLMKANAGAGYRKLRSTNPPQSPVAWTSFATGTEPGDHGIFDFIGRELKGPLNVLPKVATTSFEVPAAGPPVARNLRTGMPFWQLLGNAGVKVVALNVPYSFPPDPMREGRMLSGLGVPDLRETNSTFTYAGTEVTDDQVAHPPGGGAMVKLTMSGDSGSFELEGPSVAGGDGARMKLPVRLTRTKGEAPLRVELAGQTLDLKLGEASPFVAVTFSAAGRDVHGVLQLVALEAGAQTRLFVTPISFDPKQPYSPIAYPKEFSGQIADELGGPFKTVGWDHDTSALNAEVLDDDQFLADMERIEKQRKQMLFARLDKPDWDLLIWVSTATDRVAHMFYRLIDPKHPRYDAALAAKNGGAIEAEYRRMDGIVGEVLAKLRPDDTLLILSDHGFHNYRRGLHVNQWLRQQGLLALKAGLTKTDKQFFMDVDWATTKAYALGTGQVYLNLKGREAQGIVTEQEAPAVLEAIRSGLTALRDGDAKVVDAVYVGAQVFAGGRKADAPDLQVAFAENYRTSWETILGGVPEGLFADNTKKWSGDHAASDVDQTPGVLLSNRPLGSAKPAIVDLAPTALRHFGQTPPAHYVGGGVFGAPK
jgi:predicted AlkP superfamily phosphohydrolase/phosphomutase